MKKPARSVSASATVRAEERAAASSGRRRALRRGPGAWLAFISGRFLGRR